MINIETRYLEEEEAGRDKKPYIDFFYTLEETFDFSKINSFIDVGCSDGHLLECIKSKYENIHVSGIEYFSYHLKYASKNTADSITIADIRKSLPHNFQNKQFDIVVCTEVGEHIDPEYCHQFLQNIKSLCKKNLVMTWSKHGGSNEPEKDPHHQHLNPLSLHQYIELVKSHGFILDKTKTNLIHEKASKCKNFFSWWKESLIIWENVN